MVRSLRYRGTLSAAAVLGYNQCIDTLIQCNDVTKRSFAKESMFSYHQTWFAGVSGFVCKVAYVSRPRDRRSVALGMKPKARRAGYRVISLRKGSHLDQQLLGGRALGPPPPNTLTRSKVSGFAPELSPERGRACALKKIGNCSYICYDNEPVSGTLALISSRALSSSDAAFQAFTRSP
jgi:hypothetical protein